MIALVSVLAVVLLSLIVIRVATVLLVLTGMSHEAARFQARSAFTGVGFTTAEAEQVTAHPQRRRIVQWLMLLGSAGLVTAIASLIVSFGGASRGQGLTRALILIGGLLVVYAIARSRWIDRRLEALVGDVLRAGGLTVRDYASLLDLEGDYAVAEKHVDAEDWMAGHTLRELALRSQGVFVLGVHRREGGYVGCRLPIWPSSRAIASSCMGARRASTSSTSARAGRRASARARPPRPTSAPARPRSAPGRRPSRRVRTRRRPCG